MRRLVKTDLEKHLFSSAAYWADKAVSLSKGRTRSWFLKLQQFTSCPSGDPQDVYTLAKTYMLTQQYHRAVNLLIQAELVHRNLCCRYLAGYCYAQVKDWNEALELLGFDSAELASFIALHQQDETFKPMENVCLKKNLPASCC